MTKPLQHVSRRCAGFPLSAILVGPHRCDRKPGLTLSNRRVIHGLVKRSGDQATGEPGCAGRHRPCMKFRFVLLDPDGDSHRHTPPRENAAAAESADPAQAFRYQIRGTDMVRQERLADGRHRLIPVANFRACIVSDIILDDGVEPKLYPAGADQDLPQLGGPAHRTRPPVRGRASAEPAQGTGVLRLRPPRRRRSLLRRGARQSDSGGERPAGAATFRFMSFVFWKR